ncbi:HigA family addiction module antidote protein [Providencia stuartii]|uniref:HigA family addiction module antitoxin n=1 Tax=Providencia stuartii TaxID=588 RepID=A0AAJ1JDG5_PROST|nr:MULTISPECIES: HigA family addiction module antitoxin [Providencia]EMA3643060.1 HigA family addiction module antidote protein [Providencia stuartii]MBW3103361.1 HigA family addiction module antidote protein [Providencia stuartii]MCB5218823.1 HigA family addiction module antidote protein [Providencia stuartii]MDE5306532.1 HigA family addiction module antitoxin [Providencia stuartii]MDE8750268.1 HigA family addiction module antitoxin [Providencia thailandensis]
MKMYNPPHVGELISETLIESNIVMATFANMLNAELSFAQQLINGRINIDVELAEKLSAVLGSSPKFWLNIQNNHRDY